MKKPRELSESEFLETFSPPMTDVTTTGEEVVDLWSYADPVLATGFPDAGEWEWKVKHLYESASGEFQHALIPVPISNLYFVVVIEKPQRNIRGHYQLRLPKR